MKNEDKSSRRDFLTAGATLLSAADALASPKPAAKVTGRVLGANDRINIAFIGNGMQFQTLVRIFKNRKEAKNDVELAAVCDVWEPRLLDAQKKAGAEKTYRDYREPLVLEFLQQAREYYRQCLK